MSLLAKDHNGKEIQGFAPTRIVTASGIDVSDAVAIRVFEPTQYQINGAGTIGTMTGVTVVNVGVSSFNFTESVTFEVMD